MAMETWTLPELTMAREEWWTVHDALLAASPSLPDVAANYPERDDGDPTEPMTFGPWSDVGFNQLVAALATYHGPGASAGAILSKFQHTALATAAPDTRGWSWQAD